MNCCPQGSWPQLSVQYVHKGHKTQNEGVPIYYVGEGNQALIIISDIFGASSSRHQVVADIFASLGYNVFIPQILNPPFAGDVNFQAMIANIKSQSLQSMTKRFQKCLQFMETKGVKQYFCIGFCWGVWFAFKMAAIFDGFRAIMGPHPSLGVESKIFGNSQLALTQSIKCPAYLQPASNDPPNVKQNGEIIESLKKRFGADKTGTTQYPDMAHGWVVRGDLKDEKVSRDFHKAIHQAHDYFKKFQ